eukprot:CAMPEP_0116153862 /NCGR_PEP_ID=MMETSP0329-20121206/21471_1 /TAXON_ID=697910 /ORGANISM="Pseudo-nitzschia arenysensis, Strain B593" /LENGTH=333 /DNA_ID=CAMNT_0003650799 /DNA_START=61 /DNA_END=1061 /DNA_ORIENTATION=-
MPPSIPTPGGVSDAPNALTTRLPLIRETNGNPKELNKTSSRSSIKPTRRLSSATQRADLNRSSSDPQRNSRRKLRPLKKKSKPRRKSSPPPRNRTITNVENDSHGSSNFDSSLNPSPASPASHLDTAGLAPYGGISTVSSAGAASMMPPSPFMGMGMNTMGLPYLSGLNQVVFNIQNIIFSISQAVQIVGANQQALQHAWESLNQMVDHAVATFHEMRALEAIERDCESKEEKNRRKQLKALRYAFVFGGSWLAYKLIRNLLFRKRSLLQRQRPESTSTMFGNNHYGHPNTENFPIASPIATPYASPNNLYGASNMGHTGFSSNYYGSGNGYY